MDRKQFLKTTAIMGGATLLPTNSVCAASLDQNRLDKLTDLID